MPLEIVLVKFAAAAQEPRGNRQPLGTFTCHDRST